MTLLSTIVDEEIVIATEFLKTNNKRVSPAELQVLTYVGLINQMKDKMLVLWELLRACTLGLRVCKHRDTTKSDRVHKLADGGPM